MPAIDTAMHDFMSDPYIFSEFINIFVFNGKPVLTAKDLDDKDSNLSQMIDFKENKTAAAISDSAATVERYRDVIKKAVIKDSFILLAIENQTNISMIMPVRNALYDMLNYQSQIKALQRKNKIERSTYANSGYFLSGMTATDKICPVITFVFYYGEKPWTGPVTLHEMLNTNELPKEFLSFLPDYRINLIDIHNISDDIPMSEDLTIVIYLLKYRGQKGRLKYYIQNNPEIFEKVPEHLLNLISVILDTPWLIHEKNKYISKKGRVNMCTAIKEWYEEALSEGESRGKIEGKAEGKIEGKIEGKAEGLNLAGEIIKRKKHGESPAAIARALNIEQTEVLLITHLLD